MFRPMNFEIRPMNIGLKPMNIGIRPVNIGIKTMIFYQSMHVLCKYTMAISPGVFLGKQREYRVGILDNEALSFF